MARGIASTTSSVFFISQQLIHFHPPYGMVFHSHVHQLTERIAQHALLTPLYMAIRSHRTLLDHFGAV